MNIARVHVSEGAEPRTPLARQLLPNIRRELGSRAVVFTIDDEYNWRPEIIVLVAHEAPSYGYHPHGAGGWMAAYVAEAFDGRVEGLVDYDFDPDVVY